MASWIPTNADRNGAGHIRAPGFDQEEGTAFASALSDSFAAVGATPAPAETLPTPTAPRPRRQIALALAGVALVALLIALLATAAPVAPAHPLPTPPPAPTSPLATSAPAALPRLARALVAFSAPAGEALGAIEAGRVYTPTAVYSAAWVQLDIDGSGRVWVRAADVPEAQTAGLPDLAPPPTPVPAPPTAAPAPAAAPTAAPCDPATAPYRVSRQLGAYGSVVGVSCVSEADAIANADRLAREVQASATATAGARATPERGQP